MYTATGLLALTISGHRKAFTIIFENSLKKINPAVDKLLSTLALPKVGLHPERLAIILNHTHGYNVNAMFDVNLYAMDTMQHFDIYSCFMKLEKKPSVNPKELLDTYEWHALHTYKQLNERILRSFSIISSNGALGWTSQRFP